MKRHFPSLSFQVKLSALIGFGFLIIAVLELIMLIRKVPISSEATAAYVIVFGLNSALCLAILALMRYAYARHIHQPLHELTHLLQQPLARAHDGAGAAVVPHSASQDLQDFANTVGMTFSGLQTVLEQIAQITEPLSEASRMLLSGSQSQMAWIGFQRPAHHDMRSSLQALTATARQVSQAIHTVVDLTADTSRIAHRGQQSALNLSANMEDIQRSSRVNAEKIAALEKHTEQIHEVVATIDSIIEDTKLIAFNATIEATRAKDEGKGFSVVALEIKRLAEEVFESTEDIKAFIQELQRTSQALVLSMEAELKSVRRGRALAEESGLALQHIVDMVKRTSEAARHIAVDTEQQQETSEHALQLVETAIRSLDQLGRDLRAFMAAAERLRQDADALMRLLRQPLPMPNRQQRTETPGV